MRLILPLLALLSIAGPAWGQEQMCADFDTVVKAHAEKLSETRIAQAIIGDDLLVIFASPGGDTWSAVLVNPSGVGCLRARGSDWQTRSDPAPVQEEGL